MEGNEQKTGQNIEGIDIIKQFIKIMEQQSRQEQSQDFMEIFRYMAGMQVQLGVMADELQNVRKQLSDMKNTNPKAENRQFVDKVSHLQEKISGLSERISAVKNHLMNTVTKSVTAFREKGTQEMNKVLNRGISSVKSMLAGCREKMVDLLTDYEKTANQIDSIGDELKQIGNSFANVGRLVTGKGTKEISEEKPGVGLTRMLNMPIKRNIAALRHHIEKVDKAMNKLDTILAGLEPQEKKAEKGEKPKKEENQKEKPEKNPKKEKPQEKTDKQPEKEETSKGQPKKQAGEEKLQKKAEEKEKPAQKTEKEQPPKNNPPKKNMEKGAEKKERVSVKEKLSEMKAKSEQQKKEPEAAKNKSKEECL